MNPNAHLDADELALFAMQLLDKDQAAEVRGHLEQCSLCRRELGEVQGDLATFAMTAEADSPPALARERMLTQVAREKRPARVPAAAQEFGLGRREVRSSREGRPDRKGQDGRAPAARPTDAGKRRGLLGSGLGRALPWAGWVIAAGLAVTAGDLLHQRDSLRAVLGTKTGEANQAKADADEAKRVMEALTRPDAMRVMLTRTRVAAEPTGRASYLADQGSLVFVASNLGQLGPYKTYELWLIPADGKDPIAAGTFVPDAQGNASVLLPTLPKGVAAKAFGVTIEDEGGAQTPTMPIVLAGA